MLRSRGPELWQVTLVVDGVARTEEVRVDPPFGIAQGDAEVKAIKAARAAGAKNVRCTHSRFLREVSP